MKQHTVFETQTRPFTRCYLPTVGVVAAVLDQPSSCCKRILYSSNCMMPLVLGLEVLVEDDRVAHVRVHLPVEGNLVEGAPVKGDLVLGLEVLVGGNLAATLVIAVVVATLVIAVVVVMTAHPRTSALGGYLGRAPRRSRQKRKRLQHKRKYQTVSLTIMSHSL